MEKVKQTLKSIGQVCAIVGSICAPGLFVAVAGATPTYTSPNYGVDQATMSAGGVNDASSASYRANASLGDTAVGNSSSTNFQANSGFVTTADPYIEMTATAGTADLGYLNTGAAATTSWTFSIRSYLASGYIVTNASDPPTATSGPGTHTLANLTSPTASSPGTEQFGINLVANTSPATFGANPVQIPDASYSFGQVATGYDTANLFKYIKGDTVAYSTKSSGETDYTVSYLYNIAAVTPAGQYNFKHILVATSTF
jgi:hypothetical protein